MPHKQQLPSASPRRGQPHRRPPPELKGSSSEPSPGPSASRQPPGGGICWSAPGCYFCAASLFRERIFQQLWRPGMSQPCPVVARRRGSWISGPKKVLKFQERRLKGLWGPLALHSRFLPASHEGSRSLPGSPAEPTQDPVTSRHACALRTMSWAGAPGERGPEAGGRGAPSSSDSGVSPAD